MTRSLTQIAALTLVLLVSCTKSESATPSTAVAPEAPPTPTQPSGVAATSAPESPPKVIIATSSEITEADIAAAPRIEPTRAWQLVQSGEAVLVDVRSKEQFAAEHIPGSTNIPLWDLEERAPSELDPERWVITSCT